MCLVQFGWNVTIPWSNIIVIAEAFSESAEAVELMKYLDLSDVGVGAVAPVCGSFNSLRGIFAYSTHIVATDNHDVYLCYTVPRGVDFGAWIFVKDVAWDIEERAIELERRHWNIKLVQEWRYHGEHLCNRLRIDYKSRTIGRCLFQQSVPF